MARATTKKPTKAKTSAKKPTTTKKTAAKKAAPKKTVSAVTSPAPVSVPKAVVAKVEPQIAGPVLKKKELVERVVTQSGMKKKDVKPTVEALLEVLGKALADGEELNLQPFGKVMIKKRKALDKADIFTCRIRRKKPARPSPLAVVGE